MSAVHVTPVPVPPRRRSSAGLRALVASALLHGGLVAWAAQSAVSTLVTWSVETGTHSVAAIEASFAEGDLDAQRVKPPADLQALHVPKSAERTSPEDRLITGGRARVTIRKQPADAPPPPVPSEQGEMPPPPAIAPLSPTQDRSPIPADSPSPQLAAVPRAKRAAEVQVEPIEPSLASSASNASTASSGAAPTSPPKALSNPAPHYPAEALAAGVTGRVVVRIRLADNGTVLLAEVYRSSGTAALDEAAVSAVRGWRFEIPGDNALREFGVPVSFVIGGGR